MFGLFPTDILVPSLTTIIYSNITDFFDCIIYHNFILCFNGLINNERDLNFL
jgi:hypothetical protein